MNTWSAVGQWTRDIGPTDKDTAPGLGSVGGSYRFSLSFFLSSFLFIKNSYSTENELKNNLYEIRYLVEKSYILFYNDLHKYVPG